ncbi:hypothetical protein FOA52_000117 [Chlamydomonas sp. UWO 241]|nr:hypothetical protein FOA52_000117 [Chlamydomonas sp. UWO 241]
MAQGKRKITIAIEGCCHGELDDIYATLQHLEHKEGKKIDLLISCGDFQAVRNMDDLETMACPQKYKSLNTFYKYYSGEAKAPYPTLFIGGNHEAANYMWELYYGGWAAPSIFFQGYAGVVKFGGLRIGGLSGIYKSGDYTRGHDEVLPYNDSSVRSMYHIRDFEVHRLMQIKQPVDVFLTHDWPRNIYNYGNTQALLQQKKFLRDEVQSSSLGSPPAEQLLHTLQPSYWFSAHLHVKFPALVPHDGGARHTRFLALDKCLPGRDFLQVIEVDAPEGYDGPDPPVFEYDEEWLAIMRTTHASMNLQRRHRPLPGMGGLRAGPSPADVAFVREALAARGGPAIPLNFEQTAAPYVAPANPGFKVAPRRGSMPTSSPRNPQTVALLDLLKLPYNLDHNDQAAAQAGSAQQDGDGGGGGGGYALLPRGVAGGLPPPPAFAGLPGLPPPPARPVTAAQVAAAMDNPEEIDLGDDDDDGDGGGGNGGGTGGGAGAGAGNPEEIDLGDDAGDGDGGTAGGVGGDACGVVGGAGAPAEADPMFQPL